MEYKEFRDREMGRYWTRERLNNIAQWVLGVLVIVFIIVMAMLAGN